MTRSGLAALALISVTVSGCATVRAARDRIERGPPVCQDVTVPIYFEPGSATPTREGRQLLAVEASRARSCRVVAVKVVGLADAAGDPAANLELSRRRAAAVADAVRAVGLPAAEIDLAAAGDAGAVTPDGALRPVRRRADVTLQLAPLKR